jgi:hypothetical protein
MQFRSATGAEMMVAHCVWGNHLWVGLKGVRIVDDYFRSEYVEELVNEWGFTRPTGPVHSGRPAFVSDSAADTSFLFCPASAGVAQLVHEIGHAVHDRLYPASREWGHEQAEAFALLADVNAGRWRTLEPSERASFAAHMRGCRNNPGYERALRWAFSLRKLKLKDQMDEISRG